MGQFIKSATLLFILLNPFLLVVYMLDAFQTLPKRTFRRVVFRAGVIATGTFAVAAVLGDVLFRDILQAQFASFQVFGGIVFLMIAVRFVFEGTTAIPVLQGESQHIAGAIAMPVMIGPGTIGASIVIGKRLPQMQAVLAVASAVLASVIAIILLKYIHDYVRSQNEKLLERYIEVTGRVMALIVGTFAIEMIMRGVQGWVAVM